MKTIFMHCNGFAISRRLEIAAYILHNVSEKSTQVTARELQIIHHAERPFIFVNCFNEHLFDRMLQIEWPEFAAAFDRAKYKVEARECFPKKSSQLPAAM